MLVFDKVKPRELTRYDVANIVDAVVQAVIYEDENGEVVYRPYAIDDVFKCAVFSFCFDGITFEEGDNIIDILDNDKTLSKMVDEFIDGYSGEGEIYNHIYDVIEFRKSLYIHRNKLINDALARAVEKENALNDILLEVAKTQGKVLAQQAANNEREEKLYSQLSDEELVSLERRLASGELNVDSMVDAVVQKYLNMDTSRDKKYKDIIEQKNATITELEKYKSEHESSMMDDGK